MTIQVYICVHKMNLFRLFVQSANKCAARTEIDEKEEEK